ncbi:MAG: hypothetical protein AAF532_06905 [Planctomycetota bacterium]
MQPALRLACCFLFAAPAAAADWVVDTDAEWSSAAGRLEGVTIADGFATSVAGETTFVSTVQAVPAGTAAVSVTFTQSPTWDNWREIPNVGSPKMHDAPVFIPVGSGDYWLLGKYRPSRDELKAIKAAHGGNRPDYDRGYHAWHSTDMQTWTHHGPVSGREEEWVTTAEVVDGVFYIFYDFPNDEDPHLIIDDDLTDGRMGRRIGMVFADPSHGSDCGVIRDDADGRFHMIYENWDPIDARKNAWDSPLAGHSVSPDGVTPFEILAPAIDHRTNPTGKTGEYVHGQGVHRAVKKYEIHEPEQNAYGDWAIIKIGTLYYLFCDYEPAGGEIRVGRFVGESIDGPFTFDGELGEGHPDPAIGFAEGQFYLIRQRAETDFVSPGPWVGRVEARAGVDLDGDGKIDEWTAWQEVRETYAQKQGYVKVIEAAPARLDLSALPAGKGIAFAYRTAADTPVAMDRIEVVFD